MIKVIIFDFGGVIAKDIRRPIYNALSKQFNFDFMFVKENVVKLIIPLQRGEIKTEEFWSVLSSNLHADMNKVKRVWIGSFESSWELIDGTIDIVKELKYFGYRIPLLSNQIEFESESNKRKSVYENFSPVFLSFEMGTRKPEEKIYLLALKKLGVKPNECIFIDNKAVNFPPAERLGMRTILFESPDQLRKELKNLKVL